MIDVKKGDLVRMHDVSYYLRNVIAPIAGIYKDISNVHWIAVDVRPFRDQPIFYISNEDNLKEKLEKITDKRLKFIYHMRREAFIDEV